MYFYEGIKKYISNLSDHILSIDEIREIIESLIEYIEIQDYYSGIEFKTTYQNDLGTYNFFTKKIKINRNHIIWTAEDDYENLNLKCNKNIFINLCILEALFHEVVHAIQNYIAFEANWPLSQLLKMEIILFNERFVDDERYDRFHDLFMIEREANTTAIENILLIIKKYIKDDELFQLFLNRLNEFMIIGYEIDGNRVSSPIEYVYEHLYNLNTPYVNNIDLYDRIKLGFSITKEEYERYLKDRNTLILSKNNLN